MKQGARENVDGRLGDVVARIGDDALAELLALLAVLCGPISMP